jgi:hypothetical protein
MALAGPRGERQRTLENGGVVDDLAVDQGEYRARAAHLRVAHTEVVAVEHHEVGELADLAHGPGPTSPAR